MRIGIVGGGITGLALTHALARSGLDSVLFEAGERPGGVIRSERVDGRVHELGPQRTRWVAPVRRLVGELGLEARLVRAPAGLPLFVWTGGRLREVPKSPGRLLRADLLTPAARGRVLLEPLTSGLRDDESVADYFRRKTGSEAYRRLFGPLVSATFASDPSEMPARHALPMALGALGVKRSLVAAAWRFRSERGAGACTFADGLGELTDALARRHASRIRLGAEVTALARSPDGFELSVAGSGGARGEVVDRVVLTVPARVAAGLLADLAPEPARALATLAYNEVAVVALCVPGTPDGFGFQVALGEPLRTRGVTWSESLFDRPGTAAAYLGGGLDPDVAEWSDDRVARQAADDYERVHGTEAEPLLVGRASLPSYDGSWEALDGLELPGGITIAANYRARLGISGRIAEAESVARMLSRREAGAPVGSDAGR